MPVCSKKPDSYEDVKDGEFYLINGQHSWSAAKRLVESPDVSQDQKDSYSFWLCDFVWTKNMLMLSELSRRTNNTNQFRWDSPEYLLHIQYTRDLWVSYDKPTPADRKRFKVSDPKLSSVDILKQSFFEL
jgi:hypothetical protein